MTNPESQAARPGRITIVRHGRPALPRLDWITARDWSAWWAAYGKVGLAPNERPPPRLAELAGKARVLLASTLPRAYETALLLADGRPVEADPVYTEAHLPAPPAPGWLRLKPGGWGVVSRICWWFGYHGDGESRRMAARRAETAATRLVARAVEGEVLLCAHGWFNRMLRGALRRRGWRCVHDGGDGFWSWRCYEPPRKLRAEGGEGKGR